MQNRLELTALEQMLSSVSGAGITALTMTPFDVVKVRLQAGRTRGQVINYCNGLMDHIICCRDPKGKKSKMPCLGTECLKRNQLGLCFSQPLHNNSIPNKSICLPDCSNREKMAKLIANRTKLPWYRRSCPVGTDNPFRVMVQLARTEGVGTLWSGLPATIVMALPATVLYFTSFEQFNLFYADFFTTSNEYIAPFLAGASARFLTASIISPLELMRTRMQIDALSWRDTIHTVRLSYQAKGVRSLFLGYGATLLRDVPFSSIYFGIYKYLQPRLSIENTIWNNCAAASTAAMIAGTLTLPFDVIKTRQQVLLGTTLTGSYSIKDIYSLIIKENGYRGLYAGYSPRLMKVTPACAIMMCSYEATKEYFIQQKKVIKNG